MLFRLPHELFDLVAENCGPEELNTLLCTHPSFRTLLKPVFSRHIRRESTILRVFHQVPNQQCKKRTFFFAHHNPAEADTTGAGITRLSRGQYSNADGSLLVMKGEHFALWATHYMSTMRTLLDNGLNIDSSYLLPHIPDPVRPYRILEHAICLRSDFRLARYLIARGASLAPSPDDPEYPSLLHLAFRYPQGVGEAKVQELMDLVRLFVEKGVDVNARNSRGATPLHIGLECKAASPVLKELVALGADVRAADNMGTTPLHIFARDYWWTDEIDMEAYEWESVNVDLDLARVIFAEADVNARDNQGRTPFLLAAQRCNVDIIRMLVEEAGADINIPDNNGVTPVHLVCSRSDQELGNVRRDGWMNRRTIRNREKVDPIGAIQLLLEYGVDINIFCPTGTPLHYAAHRGCVPVIEYLLDHGAEQSLNSSTLAYGTPLHFAAHMRQVAAATVLLDRGALVDGIPENEGTPLMLVAVPGYAELVGLFAERGADLETEYQGVSMLLMAGANGRVEFVEAMLEHGAEVSWEDIDVMRNLGLEEIVRILEAATGEEDEEEEEEP